MTLVKFFTSERTKQNGQINHDYPEYEEWADKQTEQVEKQIIHMNKQELQEYARDMYGMNTKGMIASTIVKKLYEEVNGKEITKRGRPKTKKPSSE